MKNKQSRRKFIVNSSKVVATIIGFATFGRYLSYSQDTKHSKSFSKSSSLNSSEKHNKILLAYESKFGSTAGIAKFISENLSNTTKEIEVKKISEVSDLSLYSDVIIGSAIQYDKWMPEAREFIIQNEKELATKSVSFFLVCLVLSKKTEEATKKANGYANEIKNLVPKVEINSFGQFAGVLDYKKMSFAQRILAKGIFAVIGVKEGDYRDWESIKKWSSEINV